MSATVGGSAESTGASIGAASRGTSVDSSSLAEPAAGNALERLRCGSLTVDGYLDAKVDEAVAHLSLPPADLHTVRTALRDRLASDPTLVDLVRTITGVVVSPPHED